MKKFLRSIAFLLLAALLCTALFVSCGDGKSEKKAKGLVGAWISENTTPNTTVSSMLLYAFTDNGYMLSVSLMDNVAVAVLGARYEYSDGRIMVREYGKEDGVLIADLDEDVLTLSLPDSDQDESTAGKRVMFTRLEVNQTPFFGNWYYSYEENGVTKAVQYAFTSDGTVARGDYEGNTLVDYAIMRYTYHDEVLTLFNDTASGGEPKASAYRVAFPYDGYMTLEPVSDGDEVVKIYPFRYLTEQQ